MRSAIQDYDEVGTQQAHPLRDIGPFESIQTFGQSLQFEPGTCGVYSSMNYVLLGIVLLELSGQQPWDVYNQNVWGESFKDIRFAKRGPCSRYTDVDGQSIELGRNVSNVSCTNGFTCGNLIARPADVAHFLWQLFSGKLLNSSSLAEMTTFQPLGAQGATGGTQCTSWCEGCLYGLGVQAPSDDAIGIWGPVEDWPGHSGATYGFQTVNVFSRSRGSALVAGLAEDIAGPGDVFQDLLQNFNPASAKLDSTDALVI